VKRYGSVKARDTHKNITPNLDYEMLVTSEGMLVRNAESDIRLDMLILICCVMRMLSMPRYTSLTT
jgi:hypothetical protein